MKTKLFTLLLAVAASLGTIFASTKIGDLYYNLDATNQTAEVTYKSCTNYNYNEGWGITTANIPSSVTYNSVSYSVTSIGNNAFEYCRGLTSITIPNSVTSIGRYAFGGCSGLTSITIPNSVTSIGDCAFSYCISLTSPVYNAHVFAYMPTSYSGAYTIPEGIESIAGGAFDNCTGLISITIPNSVTSIGDAAFYRCTSLTSVTIPNSVTSIGNSAFGGCSGLTSVTIPNSVTSIGDWAFNGCTGLTSPVYNAHVFAYMPTSYSGAYTIPDGIESIAGTAFDGCTSLISVTIPNSVTSIGNYAFEYCSGLTSITIPNSVTSIGYYAFSGCTSLTSPVYNAHVFAYMPTSYSGAYTIPEGIESIAGGAFDGCTSLTSVTIPYSVTSIGERAFKYCSGLTSITCEANNPPVCGHDAFEEVPKSIHLYVPFGSEDAYQNATEWSKFTNIQPIKADNVDITTVEVVPDETSVNIAWPKVSGAYTYELVIKDKSGQVVCTLVFDAEGRLLSIAFNAPARDNMPQQTQVAGFAFTVTGLNSGTTYNYSIASKDSNGNTLNTESGSFKTTGESSALRKIADQPCETKFFRNGQLFIQRGNELFNAQGARVR